MAVENEGEATLALRDCEVVMLLQLASHSPREQVKDQLKNMMLSSVVR